MGKAVKLIVILIILIALGVGAKVAVDKLPTSDDSGGGSFITADALKRLYGDDPSELPAGMKVLEPADCQADDDAWVKKSECAVDGLALTGDINSCGAGKEIWIRDPDHSSFVAAVGTGTCEEEERDCTVECPVDCEGDTYIDPDPPCTAPTGVVLDGVNTCGVGLKTYELDTNAEDYVAPIGKGTCAMDFKNVCEVGCPQGVRPETSCVDYANPQKSANGCVVSKMPNARAVGYDEAGFQEWFRLPEDPTAPGCDDEGHMDSWWVPCTGPPRPVNCEGTWGADGGWGECVSEKPCEAQTEKKRTFTRTKEAAHGGTCNLPADGDIETSVVGCPLKGPCCTVDKSSPVASGEDYKQALEGGGYTCVQPVTYPSDEAYPDACLDKADEALNAGRNAEQFAKTGVIGCCWHENDWTPVVGSAQSITDMSVPVAQGGYRNCDASGKMTQKQTVYGQCDAGVDSKPDVDCEYIGEWNKTTGDTCPDDGYHRFWRTTINSSAPTTKTEACDVDCEGYYTDPACPTDCPTSEQTLDVHWITERRSRHNGAACPSPTTKTCPEKNCRDDYDGGGGVPRNYYSEWTSDASDKYRGTLLAYCNEQDGCYNEYSDAPGDFKRDRAPWLYRWNGKKVHDSDDKCIPRWKFKNDINDYADKCAKICNKHDTCKMFAINNCTCRLYSDANEYSWGEKDNSSTDSCYVNDWWHPPLWRKKSEGVPSWRKKCTDGGKWHPGGGSFAV